MKRKLFLFIMMIWTGIAFGQTDLIITATFDGPLTGGTPKGVEIFVVNDVADLSVYALGSANNGGGTDGPEYQLPADAATAGSFIYVVSEADQFVNFFGFAHDYVTGAMGINGDDAVELFYDATGAFAGLEVVVDLFGDINVDGSGQSWDHLDGWAYRNNSTGPNPIFTDTDWTFSGINVYDGATTNAGSSAPMPIGTYTNAVSTAPVINNFVVTPTIPTSTDDVDVICDITDDGTISSASLSWGFTQGGPYDQGTITMLETKGTYGIISQIPAQADGTTVYFTVTAEDNDMEVTVSSEQSYTVTDPVLPTDVADIAALRLGATDGTVYRLTGEAVITYLRAYRNQKYIQDATGGILIDDDAATITTVYAQYDGLTNVTGTLSSYFGVLQFIPTVDPGAASSNANTVTPEVVTIPDVNTTVDDYESELVVFENIYFETPGVPVVVNTNYNMTDGTNTIVFRTSFSEADYIGEDVPAGSFNVTAFVGEYNGTAQIVSRGMDDFEELTLPGGGATCGEAVLITAGPQYANHTVDDDYDQWYMFVATVTGTATVENCASDVDMFYTVDEATCGSMIAEGDDDVCGVSFYSETFTFDITQGETYYIGLGNWDQTITADYDWSLTENEAAETVATIADLRAGTVGNEYMLTGEAVITFMQSYRNQKWIQDGTGAILIDDNNGILTTVYNQYDGLTGITGTLGSYNDLMQFIPTLDHGAASSTGNTVDPQIVDIATLLANVTDYESELVTVADASFDDADGTAVFANGTSYGLTDATSTFNFRTNFYDVDYIGTVIPYDAHVTGILGNYLGTAQIYARDAADIDIIVEAASITFVVDNTADLGYTGFALKGSWDVDGNYDATWNGGAEHTDFYDDGTNGDVTAGDNIWTVVVDLVPDGGTNTWEWGVNDQDEVWIDGNFQFNVTDETAQTLTFTTVGVETINGASVSIFPNPSKGQFNITIEGNYNIELLDITGKVLSVTNFSNNTTVNVMNSGIYFLRISNEDGILVKKVIVE